VVADVADFEGQELVFEDEQVFDHEEVRVCCSVCSSGGGGGFGGGFEAAFGALEGGEGFFDDFEDYWAVALLEWGWGVRIV
jgi:hypothetical protein